MQLQGRVAIVTGGAQGIGGAIARRFAAEGASVMIADINAESAAANLERILADGGAAKFTQTDVSDPQQVDHLFAETLSAFNKLDILANIAGIVHGPRAVSHFLEMTEANWRLVLDVNLNGMFYCAQRAARIMAEAGGGGIINMSSGGGTQAHRNMSAYDTTKGGIEAATRAMAVDLAPFNIRVNALAPGAIAVEGRAPVGDESSLKPGDVIPLARIGTAEEVAAAALYLASAESAYVTGHVLAVDGGLTAQLRSPLVDAQIDPEIFKKYRGDAG
jgi:3-oxoacyl-[acyl-carrier protein] reductase